MSEFSRRVNVEIIKDEPKPLNDYVRDTMGDIAFTAEALDALTHDYNHTYLKRFQPYRWRAVAANSEPIAHGESYFNLADAINAAQLLFGDDTTVYLQQAEKGNELLRYGATDRDNQAAANDGYTPSGMDEFK